LTGVDTFDQMGLGERLRQLPGAAVNTIELYQEGGHRPHRW